MASPLVLLYKHGAYAGVAEQLNQNGVGDPAVQNDGGVHSGAHRLHGAVNLGDDPPLDNSVLDQAGDLADPNLVDKGVLVCRVPEELRC